MSTTKRNMLVLMAGLWAFAGWAGITKDFVKSRLPASADVVLGRWHSSHSKCLSYAKKHNVPYIAVWSNGDACGHCQTFEKACNDSAFKKWMAESGCVFHFAHSGDSFGKSSGATYKFCYKSQRLYPLVRVYWYVNGKKKVDLATDGDTVDGTKSQGSKCVSWFKKKLSGYKYTPVTPTPKYTGGEFGVSDEPGARLEAEAGVTTEVTLPLTRTNVTAQTSVSTNTVMATYPDGTVVTNTVIWDAGESAQTLTYDTSSLKADEQITLTMLNAAGEELGTSHITAVAPVENSPKNPLWIGERDKDSLEWGEWTMDLDVATNKVNAFNATHSTPPQTAAGGRAFLNGGASKAYTLLLIGGSLWCPDCYAADEFLFDTDAFREWATNTHKVACVAIDEPRVGGSSPTYDRPTLLTRKSYETKNYGVVSGAGYLSRKMIADDAAAKVFARNLNFATNDTQHGGFCLPDNMSGTGNTGKWKTGIPCIILLRADGSVAGRLFQFSNSTAGITAADAPALVKRLDELLEQDADADEEKNDNRHTTEATISGRQTIEGKTLSFTDTADVYRFGPGMYGKRISLSLCGTSEASLILKVTKVSGKSEIVAAVATNKLSEGISVGIDVSTDDKISWFASISYPTDANAYPVEDQFALKSAEPTLCAYTLKSDFVVIPTEVVDATSVPDGNGIMSVVLVSNETYRITGLAAAAENDEWLEQKPALSDIFTAIKTGDAPLAFMSESPTVQLWHPGQAGFATPSAFVSESSGTYQIRLVRTGGVSGTASLKVSFDHDKPEPLSAIIDDPPLDFEETFEWAEGESDEKTLDLTLVDNKFADGDQAVYFKAVCSGDAAQGVGQFKLTLRDNDTKHSGKLEISSTSPAYNASTKTAFARAGSVVDIDLARVGGADGYLEATLSATAGVLDMTDFDWDSRNAATKTAHLTLPDTGAQSIVELTPAKGTGVNADKRKITIKMLDPDVPGFERASHTIEATRYVPAAETRIALDDKAADDSTVKLNSGTLATGMKWSYDKEAKELVISGTPTKAGSTTALFRAYNGSVAGLLLAVTVDVADPVTAPNSAGTGVLNPSVAVSRTFADVPVFATNAKSLAGVLTLTIPRSGRASAKYRTAGAGTVSLSCASWSAIAGDGTLTAELTGKGGTNEYALVVSAGPDGDVTVSLDDPLFPAGVSCEIPQNVWSAANPATDFKGYYTVSLPRDGNVAAQGDLLAAGDAYVTLKMNTTAAIRMGKFAYAGVLPTGKPFSGSAIITPMDWNPAEGFQFWERALLPVMASSSSDMLAGALELRNVTHTAERRKVYRAEECALVWLHAENGTAVASEVELDAAGSLYSGTENFAQCCTAVLGKATLSFFACEGLNALRDEFFDDDLADGVELSAGRMTRDVSAAIGTVKVVYTAANKKKKTAAKNAITSSTKALKLSFTLSTGLVSGTFSLPFGTVNKTMTFSGVVMPGWGDGGSECGDCAPVKIDKSRPFISGTAWFDDEFENDSGRKVKVRRSCPFSVGVVAGK